MAGKSTVKLLQKFEQLSCARPFSVFVILYKSRGDEDCRVGEGPGSEVCRRCVSVAYNVRVNGISLDGPVADKRSGTNTFCGSGRCTIATEHPPADSARE